jgi:restriction endonuclease hincII family protein
MKKIITIEEYKKIWIKGTSKNSSDKDKYEVIDKDKFDKLKEFIKANKLHEEPKFFEISKDYVIPQNFIGSINIDDISIEIFPKIPLIKDNKDKKRKRFLEILEYVETFNENIYENLEIGNENMPILEIFISNFIEEVEKIVKKGLVYSYINKSENIYYFKGKLDLTNHIKYNFIENRFFMNFDEFSVSSIENCLIKLALEKIKNISSDMENKAKIYQLLVHFDDIQTSGMIPAHLFRKLLIDRKNGFYKKSLDLAKFFLLDESPYSVFYNDEREITGLFFPMEIIYESYIANKLKEVIDNKFSIKIQDNSYKIFNKCEVGGKEVKNNITFFKLKPDIVVEKEKEVIILDTKWKELKSSKENEIIYNFGISKEDIYQMITYIHVYNSKIKNEDNNKFCNKAYLLYPINNNEKLPLENDIVFSGENGLKVRACFVDLSSEKNTMKSLKKILETIK